MLLLVTGASGVGKSTARILAMRQLAELPDAPFDGVELFDLGEIPAAPTVRWRQQLVELAVRRAVALEALPEPRHLVFAGDPIPAGEVLAAPSADRIDVAVLLLDADRDALDQRLDQRQDPAEIRYRHHGFADWMRIHAADPSHLTEVVTQDAWEQMRWDRWIHRRPDATWAMTLLDTSRLEPQAVADRVAAWCQAAVRGEVPVFRRGWSQR